MTCEVCEEVHGTVKRRMIEAGNATSIYSCMRCYQEIERLALEKLRERLNPRGLRNVQTIVARVTQI